MRQTINEINILLDVTLLAYCNISYRSNNIIFNYQMNEYDQPIITHEQHWTIIMLSGDKIQLRERECLSL